MTMLAEEERKRWSDVVDYWRERAKYYRREAIFHQCLYYAMQIALLGIIAWCSWRGG